MAAMIRRGHRPGFVVLCIMLALVGFPVVGAAQGTATGNLPGVTGNQYTSPTYGYKLSWDSSWQVQDASSKSGVDTLELANGTSYVGMEGYQGSSSGVSGCLDDGFNSLKNDKGVSNLRPAKGSDGNDLKGGNDTAAYAVYDLTYAGQNGSRDMTEFLACYALPQQAILLVTDTVPAANYNAEAPKLQTLLGNLQIPNSSSSTTTQATAAPVSTTSAIATAGAVSTTGTSSNTTISLPPETPETGTTAQSTAATGPGPQATSGTSRQTVPISLPGAPTQTTGTAPTVATATATQGGQTGVQGNKYTSPTYGYTLSWDSTWSVQKDESSNGDDYLELDNGTSNISFEGSTNQGSTAQECLATAKQGYSGVTGVSNFQAAVDQNNTPIASQEDNFASAAYTFKYTNSSGSSSQLVIYVQCHELSQPNATLMVSQIVTASDYNDQLDARSKLLDTLSFPGGAHGGAQTPQATAEATAEATASGGLVIPQLPSGGNETATAPATGNETATAPATGTGSPSGPIGLPGINSTPNVAPPSTATTTTSAGGQAGVKGNTYTSPTFGYHLSWDSSWNVVDAKSSGGQDLLRLDNGTSSITFTGTPASAGGAQQCVTDSANASKSTPGFSNFQPAQAEGGGSMAGGNSTNAYSVFDFTYTSSDGTKANMSEFIECQALPGNGMLTIDQIVAASDYNDQIAPRRTLIDTLKIPGETATPAA